MLLKCRRCRKLKQEKSFPHDKSRKNRNGRGYDCLICANVLAAAYRKKNKLKIRKMVRLRMRKWRKLHPIKARRNTRNAKLKMAGFDGVKHYDIVS